ncbi:MAG TPA: zf-HC2 domain-containing protein [Candidatus Baltobacteraceae bacterium]|nr:zf-HC2 domain-containing protein [Candidatus Baltobacteraceae bacterium]
MNTHEHIDELAELYALGALDDAERARVDLHARSCTDCATRLGEAERFISETIADVEPPLALDRRMRASFAPRRAWNLRWGALVAAAFVLGLLPGAIFGVVQHRQSPAFDSDRAISALVNSHFAHVQFTPLAADAPKAKVLYGRGKPWRYFIAQTNRPYTVEAESEKGASVLGALHVSGGAAELFVPATSARSFVLLDGTRAVSRVKLP